MACFPFTAPSKLCLKVSWLAYLHFNVFSNSPLNAEASFNRRNNFIFIRECLSESMIMYFSVSAISSKCEQRGVLGKCLSLMTEMVIIAGIE